MSNFLILSGAAILIIGLILKFFPDFEFPLLPGDIFVKKDNFSFYFPIVSSIVISILLTIIINFFL